jgi:hypothetical protein
MRRIGLSHRSETGTRRHFANSEGFVEGFKKIYTVGVLNEALLLSLATVTLVFYHFREQVLPKGAGD